MPLDRHRRRALAAALGLLPLPAAAGPQAAARPGGRSVATPAAQRHRLALAWRLAGNPGQDQLALVDVDWAAGRLRAHATLDLPTRAHGLLALADGGCVSVATRPGTWMLRCDASGRLAARLDIADEHPRRTLNGHAEASADGAWLYTTETDAADGSGWISRRDSRRLRRVQAWPAGGLDPHHLLRGVDGALWIAVGGIPRDAAGQARDRDRMAPALVRQDGSDGRETGRWTLEDPRLSLRHLAINPATASTAGPRLGIGLQAEHDTPAQRARAPLLAICDGAAALQTALPAASGYAGDIAAGPAGGFVLSAQRAGRGLWWQPGADDHEIARLTEPCGLVATDHGRGVILVAGRGLARWHVDKAPAMLPWPQPLAPDNHAALLVET